MPYGQSPALHLNSWFNSEYYWDNCWYTTHRGKCRCKGYTFITTLTWPGKCFVHFWHFFTYKIFYKVMGPFIIPTVPAHLQTLTECWWTLCVWCYCFALTQLFRSVSWFSRYIIGTPPSLFVYKLSIFITVAIYMMTLCDATSNFTCFTILSLWNPVFDRTMYRFLFTWGSHGLLLISGL